jgi:pyruvate/2-oxoglutarate dehydrogenase complex dihydrolipoamide dehydrogenase (E3) component
LNRIDSIGLRQSSARPAISPAAGAPEIRAVDHVNVAIVGAGTAGLAALREVRDRTDDFVMINAGPYGTMCARVGCMPSKALIAAANAFYARTKLGEFGIHGGSKLVADIAAVLRRIEFSADCAASREPKRITQARLPP